MSAFHLLKMRRMMVEGGGVGLLKELCKKLESANILLRKVAGLHSSSFDLQIAVEKVISVLKKSFNLSYSSTYRL